MRNHALNLGRDPRRRRGFSVVELMLAVSIMGVIIYALYLVFNQTQRAMRAGEMQGDVAEKARAITEIVTRELQQAVAGNLDWRLYSNRNATINLKGGDEREPGPKVQAGVRSETVERTNRLNYIYFLNKETNRWVSIGYAVVNVQNGVGVLTRFETNAFGAGPIYSYDTFRAEMRKEIPSSTNYHHVADGVIHFRVTPYASDGFRMGWDTTNRYRGFRFYRSWASGQPIAKHSDVSREEQATVVLNQNPFWPNSGTEFAFKSNALPAYIDLELGLLEPETLKQYYTMVSDKNPNADKFLERQIARVHLFRQRIPIRKMAGP